jgi:hypothetical protein
MNKIEGLEDKSDYEDYWDFINYRIDGYWLDEKLTNSTLTIRTKDLFRHLFIGWKEKTKKQLYGKEFCQEKPKQQFVLF